MDLQQAVLAEAQKLFDAAGVTPADGGTVLILGLETSPARDLDDFARDSDSNFVTPGHEAHIQPRLDSLVRSLGELGLKAGVWGRNGYPPGSELNLKRAAVAAGLGHWGRNAMLLHPDFGPRLRLAAIRLPGVTLESSGPGLAGFGENALCRDCTACLGACPPAVLEPYYLRDRAACLANTGHFKGPGPVRCCDLCWTVCPVGTSRA